MRNVLSIFLILTAIGIYFGVTSPTWGKAQQLSSEIDSYNEALKISKELQSKNAALVSKVNSFDQESMARLGKLLPDNADNVRLIIDVQNIASEVGLNIRDIIVNDERSQTQSAPTAQQAVPQDTMEDNNQSKYSSVSLTFSVTSSYENFNLFLNRLEKSLRLVDITALNVRTTESPSVYTFNITLRSYWLK
jgi:Tfp pilus assembly protein PilO